MEYFRWDTVRQVGALRGLDMTETAYTVLDLLDSPGGMEAVCGNN